MRYLLFIFFVNVLSAIFSQVDEVPQIDLNIVLSNQENGVPIVGAKIILVGSDGLNIIAYTDSNGGVDVTHSDSVCITPGNTYTIEVEGVLRSYLGTSDAFSTIGVIQNTRIIRDLKVLNMVCGFRLPVILFETKSYTLTDSMEDSCSYMRDLMIEHPNIIVELGSIYDAGEDEKLISKRAASVLNYMVDSGIPAERFKIVHIERKSSGDKASDITFKILSFDYLPFKE